jgi:catechol 2,3-dioxygenase-like lactoylglutathione lyase family enzyme
MPIGHVSVGVRDVKKAQAFYDAVLGAIGYTPVMPVVVNNVTLAVGYGEQPGKPEFWIGLPHNQAPASAGNGVHIAFDCATRAQVDDFYLTAIRHGGRDDGKPGLRHEYHPDYYGAFVLDPDGNKIEACCHLHE